MKKITILLLLLASATPLAAQFGEPAGGDLYFPPKLTIGISMDMSAFYRMYGMGVEEKGEEPKSEVIVQKQTDYNNSYLPLPIIFFDQASSVVPERYQVLRRTMDADEYDERQEIDVTYETERGNAKYREILNIIGYRLSRNDTLRIELQGGYSTEAGETPEIATERAQVIGEYMEYIWRIDSSRITILPPRCFADSSDHVLAQEEARSVRIYPNSRHLLESFNYRTSRLDKEGITIGVGLAPNMSRNDIESARLVIASGDDILGETTLEIPEGDEFSPVTWSGMWFIPRKVNTLDEPLSFNMVLVTTSGELRQSNTVVIPVRVVEEEEEYEAAAEAYTETYDEYSEYSIDGEDFEESTTGSLEEIDGAEEPVEYVEHIYYYDGPLYYYNFRDSTLDRLQQMWMEERIADIKQFIAYDTVPWRMKVTAYGEGTEDPEINSSYLSTGKTMYYSTRNYFMDLFSDPDFQISLYIFPEIREGEDIDQEAMIDDLIDQMYGDRAPEIKSYQRESRGMMMDDNAGAKAERVEPIVKARARQAARYIMARIDTSRLDSVVIAETESYETYRLEMTEWLPEDRMASRMVEIEFYNAESWEWDYVDEDEEVEWEEHDEEDHGEEDHGHEEELEPDDIEPVEEETEE